MEITLSENEKVTVSGYSTDIEILSGGKDMMNGDIIKPGENVHIYYCKETGEIMIHNWDGLKHTDAPDGGKYDLIQLR